MANNSDKVLPTHQGRIAIVTGAARGIGQAICKGLAQRGANVIAIDIGDLSETERMLRDGQRDGLAIHADVSSPDDIAKLSMKVQDTYGRCDILVNNAAVFPKQTWDELTYETWRKILTVNLDSQFLMCKALVPLMKPGGWGRIVNISSDSLFVATRAMTAYKASKAGIIGFTRGLAAEVGEFGITVNAVCPGLTRTPGALQLHVDIEASSKMQIIQRVPEPDDVVGPILFLTSDDAHFVTGQTLVADGGRCFL